MLPASSASSAPRHVVAGPSSVALPRTGQMALPFLSRRLTPLWLKYTNSRNVLVPTVTVAAVRVVASVVQVAPCGSTINAAPSPLVGCLIVSADKRLTVPNSTGVAIRLLVAGSRLRSPAYQV